MVIQRNWKNCTNNPGGNPIVDNIHVASSSEDSNGSWQNLPAHTHTYGITRLTTGSQTGENILSALKQRHNGTPCHPNAQSEAAMRSLELLRMNVQMVFDKEIDVVIKKYKDKFFAPAIKNIKDNLGENSVSEEQLRKIWCTLLDNSKDQYKASNAVNPTFELSDSDSSIDTTASSNIVPLKRKDTDSEPDSTPPIKKHVYSSEILHSTLTRPSTSLSSSMRPRTITWNTSSIGTETNFVFDFQANKAFGVIDLRDRLTSKHPELIRYSPDNQDRDWLISQKLISPLTKNGRFLFLVQDEVQKLADQRPEYKNNSNVKVNDLQGFKLPEFILKKMQKYFTELSIKNQGIRTNSGYFDTTTTTATTTTLIGQQSSSMMMGLAVSGVGIGSVDVITTKGQTVTTTTNIVGITSNSNVGGGAGVGAQGAAGISGGNQIKPRSALSSTHATLSALLSSPGDGGQDNDG